MGTVAALGDGAAAKYGLEIGDRAVSEQIVPCGDCRYCQCGQYWMCDVHDIYGFRQATFGAMAEYMRFPAKALNYKVPESISLQTAKARSRLRWNPNGRRESKAVGQVL